MGQKLKFRCREQKLLALEVEPRFLLNLDPVGLRLGALGMDKDFRKILICGAGARVMVHEDLY